MTTWSCGRPAASRAATAALIGLMAPAAEADEFLVGTALDGGPGSLRQAILDANARPGADVIRFDPLLSGATIRLDDGPLVVADDLAIVGPRPEPLTIAGDDTFTVLIVGEGAEVRVEGVVITGGYAGHGRNADGGGIFNGGTLTLANTTITANAAERHGGGIRNAGDGVLTLVASTVSGNQAGSAGGGIHTDGEAALYLRSSTLSGNRASLSGGGVGSAGGAVEAWNSTIFGNSAGERGGGIESGGPLTLASTLVAGNRAPVDADLSGRAGVDAAHSLVQNAAGHGLANGVRSNIVGLNPILGPLKDNGGPTATHALLIGSPAIDRGSNPGRVALDQRGFFRDDGNGVDIGAFEARSRPADVADLRLARTCVPEREVIPGERARCTIAVDNLGPLAAADVRVTDRLAGDPGPRFRLDDLETSRGSCGLVAADTLTVACKLGDLEAGEGATIGYTLVGGAPLTAEGLAIAESATTDPDPTNNRSAHVFSIVAPADGSGADLTLKARLVTKQRMIPEARLVYRLTVRNLGPDPAVDVRLTDALPLSSAHTRIVRRPAACAVYHPDDNMLVCDLGTLAAGERRTLDLTLRIDSDALTAAPFITNFARVSSPMRDPRRWNNDALTLTWDPL